jgi:hypothetical protein
MIKADIEVDVYEPVGANFRTDRGMICGYVRTKYGVVGYHATDTYEDYSLVINGISYDLHRKINELPRAMQAHRRCINFSKRVFNSFIQSIAEEV